MNSNFFKERVRGLIKYIPLLNQLVKRDIKVRYRKSFLGMLWTVLNPLMMMCVMTIVFSTLFKSNIDNFPVYFLTGNLLFAFNSEATQQALSSIVGNALLIKKIYVPKYLFPVSRVVSCLVNFFFSFTALLIVMIITKSKFYITMLLIPLPILALLLFTIGLSLLLSSITVFFRDIGHFYSVFILAWNYLTPVFYPVEILPDNLRWIINFNPMYYYITYFRLLIRDGMLPSLELNLYCFGIGIVIFLIGILGFWRKQDKFILYI